MPLKTTPFDPAKYLDDAQSHSELLADALSIGDRAYIVDALGVVARAQGMTILAQKAGIPRDELFRILEDEGDEAASRLRQLLITLGVEPMATAAE